MKRIGLSVVTLALTLLATSTALAQSRGADVHFDLDVPDFGVTVSTADQPRSTPATTLRMVHRSGHGVLLSAAWSGTYGIFLGPQDAHADLATFDLAYVYRFRPWGDDRMGVGIDLIGGPSGGFVVNHDASCGFSFSPCDLPPAPVANREGAYFGVVAGASLDLRLRGFLVGIDARYHGMLGLEDRAGRVDLHAFTAGAHLGFSF